MISLYDGQITDLLPWKIAQSTEVRCISYAVQQEHQRMLRLAAHTRTMAVIDELPERYGCEKHLLLHHSGLRYPYVP